MRISAWGIKLYFRGMKYVYNDAEKCCIMKIFLTVVFTKCFVGNQNKNYEMNREFIIHAKDDKFIAEFNWKI
jgi:hypothetical protein